MKPTVRILGTHGVPASYGGFETAAEHVGRYLRDAGWRVVVYCQRDGDGPTWEDSWEGLERVNIPERRPGWRGTGTFDLKSIRHAWKAYRPGEVWLTFGYNTAMFDIAPRVRGVPMVINMDGMEWTRAKWGLAHKAILLANERIAGAIGHALIADHPEIARYLRRHFGDRRVSTITYGAPEVEHVPADRVHGLGLQPGAYATLVSRPTPENSVREIVAAWSARRRGMPLVVVGPYDADEPYCRAVRAAAGDEIVFTGAIFEQDVLRAVRFHSALYVHGHTVGGTNPSLVEAMGAGNAILAQDNVYNRWVAGDRQEFFGNEDDLRGVLDRLLDDRPRLAEMGGAARDRFRAEFTWDRIGHQYHEVLTNVLGSRSRGTYREPSERTNSLISVE
ncbi:DUF1972 domain-containing protein [Epidermidibacterium keratini]|uniref:DUF1972 domain-containing protein n=1 Tax=Epidermidibacterium keratini TaxID=1891644 RepID=A0A7L4YMP5_9ACTN|nr:DUF1972 domain-containing protein [Epidermidibacterium keratini]QHC00153.1 DUF1972 domain-containing protein [Epidermidibacterium keratini]